MKFFFVTGMGRSGTKLLAEILDEVADVTAHHEYLGGYEYALMSWYLREPYVSPYLRRARASIESTRGSEWFVDVNSALRYSVEGLRRTFEPVDIFHLVRDPRDVIRSIYARRNEARPQFLPKEPDRIETWLDADKFTRICMNWADCTSELVSQGTTVLRLEALISDYSYLENGILDHLGLELPRAAWQARVQRRVNATRARPFRLLYSKVAGRPPPGDELPPYSQWSAERKHQFVDICGAAMERVGYKVPSG
jgi:hypothetical protein